MTTPRRVVVTGATGLVGRRLVDALLARGDRVLALTRRPQKEHARTGLEFAGWSGERIDTSLLRGADAIVHLAGEPIFGGLPTKARLRSMWTSRVDPARAIAASLGALPASERPRSFVCASAVGYYGDRGEETLDETSAPGTGYLAELCVAWEAAAAEVEQHGVRRVSVRFGVVLSREGGALAQLARVFRLGLGGRVGDGRQWFPWVHLSDAVGLVHTALDAEAYRGAVNAVAPQQVRNAEFSRALADAVRRPALIPVPAFALRAALGEISGELLGSKRVVPQVALARGFAFACPRLEEALAAELAPPR